MSVTTSTRRAVTEALFHLAEHDPSVVFVSSDSVGVIKAQDFVREYPERCIEMGISEQAAIDCAAGLATTGLKPVYVTYAVFAAMRACEQVRSIVGYSNLNVTIVGANGGMGAGEREGVSHQGLEDIGILRTIPGMTILVPADAGQVRQAVVAAAGIPGPVYVRTGSGKEPLAFPEGTVFEVGKSRVLEDSGNDVIIFCCGLILHRVDRACALLKAQGVGVKAVEVPTIKPLNTEDILGHLEGARAVVTVEDHTVIGGLGSAIAELNVQTANRPMRMIGVPDVFPESGTADELFDKYGMTPERIRDAALDILAP